MANGPNNKKHSKPTQTDKRTGMKLFEWIQKALRSSIIWDGRGVPHTYERLQNIDKKCKTIRHTVITPKNEKGIQKRNGSAKDATNNTMQQAFCVLSSSAWGQTFAYLVLRRCGLASCKRQYHFTDNAS